MKNLLIYTALPLNNATSVLHNDLIDVVKIASKVASITIVSKKKLEKYYRTALGELPGVRYVNPRILEDRKDGSYLYDHNDSWIDSLDSSYDSFLTFGLLAATNKHVEKTLKTLHEDNKFKITFASTQMHIVPFVVVDDVMKKWPNLKMFCKVTDYNEPDMAKVYPGRATMLGLYEDPSNGYKKFHDIEYCTFKDGFKDGTKNFDFVFGYTVTFAARKYLSEFIRDNVEEDDKVKLFLKDMYWKPEKRDNLIPNDEYKKMLSQSKFTLIAPSTVVTEFSLERFNEAVSRKCIPIFMEQVKYDVPFGSDKAFCKFISEKLTYRQAVGATLNKFVQSIDYSALLEELLSFDYIKSLQNVNGLEKLMMQEIGL